MNLYCKYPQSEETTLLLLLAEVEKTSEYQQVVQEEEKSIKEKTSPVLEIPYPNYYFNL